MWILSRMKTISEVNFPTWRYLFFKKDEISIKEKVWHAKKCLKRCYKNRYIYTVCVNGTPVMWNIEN